MARLPTTLGDQSVPRPQRGFATIRPGIAAAGGFEAAQIEGRAWQQLGDSATYAGRVLQERQDRITEEIDSARVREADVALADEFRSALYDPTKGYLSKSGRAAIDGHKAFGDSARSTVDRIASGLKSEKQRNAFKQGAAARLENTLDAAERHVSQEFATYKDQTWNARIESLTSDGLDNYSNPQQLEFYRSQIGIQVGEKWRARGASDETIKNEMRSALDLFDGAVKRKRLDDLYSDAVHQSQSNPDLLLSRLGGKPVAPEMDLATPELISAVIQRESAGKPGAVSSKGAKGLMQLMPDTARAMARRVGLPFNEKRLTEDAEYNKALGTAYLNEMLTRYDGNVTLALAAYNAGPGKVDEWLGKLGDPRKGEVSNEEWIEAIPYEETREYVPAVLGGASRDPELAELEPEQAIVLMGKAESRQRELQAIARAAIEPRAESEIAALQRGNPVQTPVTDLELQKAYGPEGAVIRRQQIDQAKAFGLVATQIAMKPMPEAVATVDKLRPTDTNDPLYPSKLRDYDLARQALAQMNQDRAQDPAAYVLQNSTDLQAVWKAADGDPSLVGPAMSQTIELQRQIGISETQIRPLPDDVAKAWLHEVSSADSADKQLDALTAFLPENNPDLARRAIDQIAALPGGQVYSVAAGLSLTDKGLAHDVLAGQRMQSQLKGSKGLGGDAIRTELDALLGNLLAFNADARGAIIDSTMALYAKSAVEAGEANSDTVSTERLEEALTRITGGVVEFRGQHIIPPQHGMDDSDLDDLLDKLTDADLGRAMFSTGEPVTADDIRDAGSFQSAADGQYMVLIDGLPVIDTETLRPFTLDMRPLLGREPPKEDPVYLGPPGIIAPAKVRG